MESNQSPELNELLPCPFCGKKPELKDWNNGYVSGFKVICHLCDFKRSYTSDKSKVCVIADWNTRALPPAQSGNEELAKELTALIDEWAAGKFGYSSDGFCLARASKQHLISALNRQLIPQKLGLTPDAKVDLMLMCNKSEEVFRITHDNKLIFSDNVTPKYAAEVMAKQFNNYCLNKPTDHIADNGKLVDWKAVAGKLARCLELVSAEWEQKRWDDKYINSTIGLQNSKYVLAEYNALTEAKNKEEM